MKHSPLPWKGEAKRASDGYVAIDITAADGAHVGSMVRPFSARIYVDQPMAVMHANAAHLLLAVKAHEDLVDALMRVLPVVEDAKADPAYKAGYIDERLEVIRKALAKAGVKI